MTSRFPPKGLQLVLVKRWNGQKWAQIQRLTISRQPMGSVFHALLFFHGPSGYFGTKVVIFMKIYSDPYPDPYQPYPKLIVR